MPERSCPHVHLCLCSDILAATGELSASCAQLKQDIAHSELPCDKVDKDFGANGMDMVQVIEQKGQASATLAAAGWPDAVHRC